MTDRELLESAAKAAGMVFSVELQHSDYGRSDWGDEVPHADGEPWNPLTDDGDRYRLANVCRMRIDFLLRRVVNRDGKIFDWVTTGPGDDEAHAIVRAAAAMVNS